MLATKTDKDGNVLGGRSARFHKKRCIEERATPRTPQTIAARRRRGVELSTFGVSKPEEIAPAINATKASGAEAIDFLATPLFSVPGSPDDGRFQCDQGVFPAFSGGKKRALQAPQFPTRWLGAFMAAWGPLIP